MVVDITNVLLYFEDDLEELFSNVEMTDEDVETVRLAKISMRKDRSIDNTREQVNIIQGVIDYYILNTGESAELLIVQGRLNQIRSLYGIVDTFEEED